jgi:hypothetical protein
VPEPELSPHTLSSVCVSRGGGTFHTDRNWPAAAALPLSRIIIHETIYEGFADKKRK